MRRWPRPKTLLWVSVAVAVTTIALKTWAWWLTNSVGLMSDALESLVNLASALFAVLMVSIAQRPPDAEHPYGHYKAEYFSSGFEGLLIIAAALGIMASAVHRLWYPQAMTGLGWGLLLSMLSSVINGALAWVMFQSAKQNRSIALEADAEHLLTDLWTSAGVVAGLIIVWMTGWVWMDAVVAVGIGLHILKAGVLLVMRSSQGLMDEAIEPETLHSIHLVLNAFEQLHNPTSDKDVWFDHLRSRRSGHQRYIELHMHMPAEWTLQQAARLRADITHQLVHAVPGLQVLVQLLPNDLDEEHEGLHA
jgi:cation diffusion facilitator family transporter